MAKKSEDGVSETVVTGKENEACGVGDSARLGPGRFSVIDDLKIDRASRLAISRFGAVVSATDSTVLAPGDPTESHTACFPIKEDRSDGGTKRNGATGGA